MLHSFTAMSVIAYRFEITRLHLNRQGLRVGYWFFTLVV